MPFLRIPSYCCFLRVCVCACWKGTPTQRHHFGCHHISALLTPGVLNLEEVEALMISMSDWTTKVQADYSSLKVLLLQKYPLALKKSRRPWPTKITEHGQTTCTFQQLLPIRLPKMTLFIISRVASPKQENIAGSARLPACCTV